MQFPHQCFFLLIAPPAWGKTRMFQDWLRHCPQPFLFISPLRALALEVKARAPAAWVALPEELSALDWEGLARERPDLVVVWDEVHLVREWGESFRHALLEAWYGYCLSGLSGVGLTATADEACHEFLRHTLAHSHQHLIIGDAGNMSFHHPPSRWWWGSEAWVREFLARGPLGRTLIFCRHRHEVDAWVGVLRSRGVEAWGVKGGETRAFSERLARESAPPVIVATSCLSHGVNLPALERVVLLDAQAPAWLCHQMSTRAGRDGSPYEVWASWPVKAIPWRQRPLALLRALFRAMMTRAKASLEAWCYGV